ncbi:MAG: methyltransferase domain-containing protein [Rhodovarius sp.]|nr:methyltransferase domain-containing protein [Rhodovarius sp.]MCX7933578.1 methyltransferase domain-containing protein [Rhodovarius sp.]MDW8314009.1 methyltransferase domain-containing protein [Rhodovarius sp.]
MSGIIIGKDREHRSISNAGLFFRRWLANPLQMGSIIPSSPTFCRLIAERVERDPHEVVVELGAGTGVVSRALLAAGIPADKLLLVEIVPDMAEHLRRMLPGVRVVCGDAFELPKVLAEAGNPPVGDVVCGIPLVMLPAEQQRRIVSAMLEASPRRGFLHLSYCITSPLPKRRLGLTGGRLAYTWRNFPPGGVWRYAPARS